MTDESHHYQRGYAAGKERGKEELEEYKASLIAKMDSTIVEIEKHYKDMDTSRGSVGHASMMAELLSHYSFRKLIKKGF